MQNPTNDCTEEEGFYRDFCEIVDWFDFNRSASNDSEGQTENEQSEKEAFESLGRDKFSHEIVSPNNFQNFVQENHLIDHNYCSELESFHCNFCEAENQVDCICSDSDDDSEEKPKNEKVEKEVKEKPKKYACNFKQCEASYKTKEGLKVHIDSKHLNLKPFKCTECQSSFAYKVLLQDHVNAKHLKSKPFKCDQCSYSASSKTNLDKHDKYVHQKLRPHNCSDCGKTFLNKSGLQVHVNVVHLKLKLFRCCACDASFAYKYALNEHIKNVHQKPEN